MSGDKPIETPVAKYSTWLQHLADKGGKGSADGDARSFGQAADLIRRQAREIERRGQAIELALALVAEYGNVVNSQEFSVAVGGSRYDGPPIPSPNKFLKAVAALSLNSVETREMKP